MKRKILLLIFLAVFFNSLSAQGIKAYLSYAAFNTIENEPYLETYLTVKGSSIRHIASGDKFQGTVIVQIIFRQDDNIVNFAKYKLAGPLSEDTLSGVLNFLDVQRYTLGNGSFDIEVKMNDLNTEDEPITSFDQYTISFPEDTTSFSDIEFLTSFSESDLTDNLSRNGYQLIPYVFNYFPENANSISFYTEMYNHNIENGSGYLLSYYIKQFETNKILDNFSFVKRKTADTINPVLGTIDIKDLPSGNYLLVIEARDRNNELICNKESFFQNYNPSLEFNIEDVNPFDMSNSFVSAMNSHDTLAMYISWLKPISSDAERTFTVSLLNPDSDINDMKKYFLNFWVEKDKSYPEEAWLAYKFNVEKTIYNYSTQNTPGFDTDRGRVFLQYGAPNVISESYTEPNAFPYEIWHFYQLPNGQTDKKFVFYTQEIATNDFELIHSDAIGELNNYKWRLWINNRDTRYTNLMNVDDTHYREIWGSNQDDYYHQPR